MKSDIMLPDCNRKFDIVFIMSSLDDYKPIMKKVFDLLNPNGFLMMLAKIESTMYYVGNTKYFVYPLLLEDVKSTLKEVGFTLWHGMWRLLK